MQKPFEGVENLEAAYDLETPEDNIKLYAAWADTYDTGYRAPAWIIFCIAKLAKLITRWAEGQRCWTSAQAQAHWPKSWSP